MPLVIRENNLNCFTYITDTIFTYTYAGAMVLSVYKAPGLKIFTLLHATFTVPTARIVVCEAFNLPKLTTSQPKSFAPDITTVHFGKDSNVTDRHWTPNAATLA